MIAALMVLAVLGLGTSRALASVSFGSSPLLDDFAADSSLSPSWTTPALGEPAMEFDTATHDLTGAGTGWGAAMWNATSFTNPVEAWATLDRVGTGDAFLYADISNGSAVATGGYFVDFAGTTSGNAPDTVSLWRINPTAPTESELSSASAPYSNLQAGDSIGLSVSGGVLTAWYEPVGSSSWTAVASASDSTFTTGNLVVEAIPASSYGFSVFHGGAESASGTPTTTSIVASAGTVDAGGQVTYTATVAPVPPSGTIAFVDNGTAIGTCGTVAVTASGKATCTVTYGTPGSHVASATYSGTSDGTFAASSTTAGARVTVLASSSGGSPSGGSSSGGSSTGHGAGASIVGKSTSTELSASNATPFTRAAVVYTATVSPTPDRGTVTFTDNGSPIGRCMAVELLKGIARCKVSYVAAGTHAISSSYSGDISYAGSATRKSPEITVSSPPRLSVGSRALLLTASCPAKSGGCRITAGASITLPRAEHQITLKALTERITSRTARFALTLSARAQSAIRSFLRNHRDARISVVIKLSIHDGDGSRGTNTTSYTVRG